MTSETGVQPNGHGKPDQNMTSPAKQPRRRSFLDVGPFVLLLFTIAGSCGAWFWAFDLCAHFRYYYFIVGLIWAIAIFKQRRSLRMGFLVLSLIWNGWSLSPYLIPNSKSERELKNSLTLISLNVLTSNQRRPAVLDYLRTSKADVVLLMEVSSQWEIALKELADIYPFQFVQSREDNFGIGILSRIPLEGTRFQVLGGSQVPCVFTTVEMGNHKLRIIGTHPLPPIGAEFSRHRDDQLRHVAELARDSKLPCVVAGDFNATPWSSAFKEFAVTSQLQDSMRGNGVQGSWNAKSPLIRIPIDHVFVDRRLLITGRKLGPDVGSDHFPVEVRIGIPVRIPASD